MFSRLRLATLAFAALIMLMGCGQSSAPPSSGAAPAATPTAPPTAPPAATQSAATQPSSAKPAAPPAARPRLAGATTMFTVSCTNQTGATIDQVMATFGKASPEGGTLKDGDNTNYGVFRRPFPAEATVSWKSADGQAHSVVAPVASMITPPQKEEDFDSFEFQIAKDGTVKTVFPDMGSGGAPTTTEPVESPKATAAAPAPARRGPSTPPPAIRQLRTGPNPMFSIAWTNQTGAAIDQVTAAFGKARETCGALGDGDNSGTMGPFHRPFPPEATVTWKSADGQSHSVVTPVASLIVPPQKEEDFHSVEFHIAKDGTVRAAFIGRDEKGMPTMVDRGESPKAEGDRKTGDAMIAAARSGDLKAVHDLLDNGADVDAKMLGRGGTALEAACGENHLEVAAALLEHKAAIGVAMQIAAGRATPEMLELLSKHGGNVNASDPDRRTPAMNAVDSHKPENLRWLLDHGAEPNLAEAIPGRTPFFAAAVGGDADCAVLLVQHGADIKKPFNGKTGLEVAREGANQPGASALRKANYAKLVEALKKVGVSE
ncbi:MAG: ankyrin repeat domain-containing protein [Planctomycetota bacterium]|nr:ankyrin repeat domain-containing protein [Planctomycetota bacterium]